MVLCMVLFRDVSKNVVPMPDKEAAIKIWYSNLGTHKQTRIVKLGDLTRIK